ncbi:ATP-binding protein [Acrocarpospora catenulata]|uniref:ATP-binding protein n=1 Tax=Acrocarpospora catenulata TaxID=2836182 RepID=UPI001BDAE836|nr:ATP-binding protein [Acrocarpospora catenulata]
MSTSSAYVTLHDEVRARLAASALTVDVQRLILDALGAVAQPEEIPAPSGIYLGAVSVRAFRGIGRAIRLPLTPGNGLTVVTGRNGSGKSSFAEAIEIALTGENSRWKGRTQAWTGGYANLHESVPPEIEVELAISGETEPSLVNLTWTGDKYPQNIATVTRPGRGPAPLSSLGLGRALADHRPFLPYAELGTALDSAVDTHDKISAILGLGPLAEACKNLHDQTLSLTKTAKKAKLSLPALVDRLAAVDDPRARAALVELNQALPDFSALEALLSDARRDEHLHRAANLTGPDIQAIRQAANRLYSARKAVRQLRETAAEDARARADLLGLVLAHRDRNSGDPACPVCATPAKLDGEWAARAAEEITRLRGEAAAAESAQQELNAATEGVRRLIIDPPADIPEQIATAWQEWTAAGSLADLSVFVAAAQRLADQCQAVRDEARQRLSEQDGQWQQIVPEVAAWCRDAREAIDARTRLATVKKADDGARALHDSLRAERMAAQGQEARIYWQIMRGQSNVSLGEIRLGGQGRTRHADLNVSVDDISGSALGVMSQGELHALALSLFLPRALVADSPFQFLVIDDPVQSMDPEKVDGLAQLLDAVAKRRQVVVFTHDSRLPEAIRRLNVQATILEVIRKERSEVAVEVSDDPVERALKNARGIAGNPRLPTQAGAAVLPGMCRVALETAFVEVARRRLLADGVDHATTEKQIADARSTGEMAVIALGVPQQKDVSGELSRRFGAWAADVYEACNQGSHEPQRFYARLRGSGSDPIAQVTKLVRKVREMN